MSSQTQGFRLDLADPRIRAITLFAAMFVLIVIVGFVQGAANTSLLLTQAVQLRHHGLHDGGRRGCRDHFGAGQSRLLGQ
jgi:hypothetical protein